MKPFSRRPAPLAVVAAFVVAGLAFGVEGLALSWGGPAQLGPFELRVIWAALAALAAAFFLFDGLRIAALPEPRVERVLPSSLALHDWAEVRLLVEPADRRLAFQFVDAPPLTADCEGLPLSLPPTPGERGRVEMRYRVRPHARGDAEFGRPTLRGTSPAGLWRFTALCGEAETVRVFPNFATVARYDALHAEDLEAQVGIIRQRRRGEGTEFHQLREYRLGDSMRQIDWKATSRKQNLISREYQDEQDQRVLLVLDSSRRMRAKEGDLSHFDHCLNAMILLAHVALRGGDAVGLLSFGEKNRWLPPGKGVGRVHQLLDAVYDLEPTTVAADFRVAAEELGHRAPRRSLVVLLTTLRAEDVDDLTSGLAVLQRRHLVLVVNLRPESLDDVLTESVEDVHDAFRYVGAFAHDRERRRLGDALQQRGVLFLDASPSRLTPSLISSYLAVKRSGVL